MRGEALLSSITRLALGAFPVLLVLVVRAGYGSDAFNLAAAATNGAAYLSLLLLSGFALVPPAVARLRAEGVADDTDRRMVRDHVALARWLIAAGLIVTATLWVVIDDIFPELATLDAHALRTWFLIFATLGLSQIGMTLWLGVAQACGRYWLGLLCTALPRGLALVVVVCASLLGVDPGQAIGTAVMLVISGHLLLSRRARQALLMIDQDALKGDASPWHVLPNNLSAGLIGVVGMLVTILPVTLVGRASPSQVGVAQVIVGLANALGGVVVAFYFPLSLTLAQRLREPGGLTNYCLKVARGVGLLVLIALLTVAAIGGSCDGLLAACHPAVLWTTALVLAGAGLRLGSLGTQHIALYQRRPHLNLVSATAEALAALAILLVLLPSLGLPALGWALLAGGALRFGLALGLERRWLARGFTPRAGKAP